MGAPDDLLSAVDRLSLPVTDHIAQKDDDGKWLRAHTVVHAPLLQQLGDAVNPSSNTTAGSASSPATRAPLDVSALFEYARITAAIRDWCRMLNVRVVRDPVQDLRAWYAGTLASVDFDTTWHVRELSRWADLIINLLNPGQQFEADYPCPICKKSAWGDAVDGGSTRAILVSYRKDDDGLMTDEKALCRPCRTVWVGHESLMELAEEQHEGKSA